jgi:hypothetical protein
MKKLLGIIDKRGNLKKEMKGVTPLRLREIRDGITKADFARHGKDGCFLTERGKRKIKK